MTTPLTDVELGQLVLAHELLESRPLAMRFCDALGMPLETAVSLLPRKAKDAVHGVTEKCLRKAMDAALRTMGGAGGGRSSDLAHKCFVTASGFLGGLGGMAGFAVEAPISTVVMLRSIFDVARAHGADLSRPEIRLECLNVFALSGGSRFDGSMPGYYAARAVMPRNFAELAARAVVRGAGEEGGGLAARFVAALTDRFAPRLVEKFAAQSLPLAGAAGGAAVNYVFVSHFQDIARGHFLVRRLESVHGEDAVRQAYRDIAGKR